MQESRSAGADTVAVGVLDSAISLLAFGARIYAELGRQAEAEAQALADQILSHDAEAVAPDGTELAWSPLESGAAVRSGRSSPRHQTKEATTDKSPTSYSPAMRRSLPIDSAR